MAAYSCFQKAGYSIGRKIIRNDHSVIGYGGIAWYKSDAPGYGKIGPNTDVTQTVPSLDMQQVYDYAKSKGQPGFDFIQQVPTNLG